MKGKLHIVALGDSLAYGAGDESRKGIAGRLESELRSRGLGNVETENLGVNGAQTADLLARLHNKRLQDAVTRADAIVLSIGANDLFRSPGGREQSLRDPLGTARRILGRIADIVAELHELNQNAQILILGGYNPVPSHPFAPLIDEYIVQWDDMLSATFDTNRRVAVVRMKDIVGPHRLSTYDSFHPGREAYEAVAKRIAEILVATLAA